MKSALTFINKYWLDIAAVVFFVVTAFAYFMPADIDGRVIYQHDASAGRGAGQEIQQYKQQTGETSRWTNALFSGMPTYQSAPSYNSTTLLGKVAQAYHLWLPEYVWYLFAYLLGFYILLRAMAFRRSLAILGAVTWAFSSYFLIIIAAGHIWKVMALAYLPPLIAGVMLAYRGKYLWGFILTALFTALEVNANHVQMTYYYLFIIIFMLVAFLVVAIRKKQMARFWKASAVCVAGAAIGIALNISNLYHTWQYSQESMRGKSELVKEDSANQTSSGLERDYITRWSYGIGETWTLLVPDVKGGASVGLAQNGTAMKKADAQLTQLYNYFTQYFGDQPGTSGPVYVGAFVLFLFVLSLFIVKGPMKWALLAVTLLSVLLAWGRHLMPFTNFFIDYIPMYAKFRSVSSILVIAEFTIPLMAIMALKVIIDQPAILSQKKRCVWISLAVTAGAALLIALAPTLWFGQLTCETDNRTLSQMVSMNVLPQEYVGRVLNNLSDMRAAMVSADAWRSLIIILIGILLLLLYKARKIKAPLLTGSIIVLCLIDLWQVDKRYLNDGMFVESSVRTEPIEATATDKIILNDKALDYRVLNLAGDTFNENETSYFHKSIGGYHAAKLRRYQELIEAYIAPEMQQALTALSAAGGDMTRIDGMKIFPVLNMLNTKYIIVGLQNGQTVPLTNPYAFGNAWMVDSIRYVSDANAELDGIKSIDLQHVAIADKKFSGVLGPSRQQEGVVTATLRSYAPNHLVYDVNSPNGGVMVLSEIYYPGWTASVDGKDAKIGRVDYVLRAIALTAGTHEVVFDFHPQSIRTTESVAYVSYGVLVIAVLAGVALSLWRRRKKRMQMRV